MDPLVGHGRDPDPSAAPGPATPVRDGPPAIGAEPNLVHRALKFVVCCLGAGFSSLAGAAGLLGFAWIVSTLGEAEDGGVRQWLEESLRALWPGQVRDVVPRLAWVVAPPVLFTVIVPWLFHGIGRGLCRFSGAARWGAMVVLVPACLGLLVVFFVSIRAGVGLLPIGALTTLLFPAAGALALASPQGDVLFHEEHQASIRPEAGDDAWHGKAAVVALFWLSLFLTVVMYASVG